jgi:hypothetical protein
LEDARVEKPIGKTWLEDGENVVRRGRQGGAQELGLWIGEVASWRDLLQIIVKVVDRSNRFDALEKSQPVVDRSRP